jgi:PAS domain S-box-containing protein
MARSSLASSNFSDCLTIGEAAEFLGVSTATLRNWDRSGKLKPRRHPQNGYRIYLHEDLAAVLRSAELKTINDESLAPQVDWSQMREAEHFVQFYENDAFLVESVTGYVGAALREGDCALVVATTAHRAEIERKLIASRINVEAAEAAGRYVAFDARDALSQFMVDGAVDYEKLEATLGEALTKLLEHGRRIHVFGEMVALLWADGDRDSAIALEQHWNEIAKQHRFPLFCAYPIEAFASETDTSTFETVCNCHTRVIPTERYATVRTEDERLRAISLLEQKAISLEAEIEHRREVEETLRQRERELADFFENATEGIHKVGPDGSILWANRAEYGLLGYAADEYIGRPITEFHADPEVAIDILNRLKQGESLVNFGARMRCKNGTIKHVLISSNACLENGQFAYTRCFTRDVTPQWQAEQSLLEANRRKDEFLATLSHELRNPLAPIRNALELIESEHDESRTRSAAACIIDRQVTHLTRLVDDLLDVSRITRDKIELRKEDVDLATVIRTAVETSRPAIDTARHDLQITLPGHPVQLRADAARLSQVFANLLNNSAKFTPVGGKIAIEVRRDGRDVIVSVRDNGIGISADALAYVFDMFRQADQSLEKTQGGLGIGLTLVRRLVELHGGSVNAQSEGDGKGSEFTVRLPLANPALQKAKRTAPNEKGVVAKRRVLVVDDNVDSGDTLALLLRVKGHEVGVARDGLEAIDKADSFRPEIILMDVGMPKLNGYEATQRIRATDHGREIYIVALTGWGQASDIARSLDAGCSAHLVKPVDFAALDELLAAAPASD